MLLFFLAVQQYKICEVENVIGNEHMVIQYADMLINNYSCDVEQE